MGGPRDYSAGTRAALATLSQGHCYYPDCRVPTIVFINGEPIINYHIAHIRDAKPGNRYVEGMTDDERRSFENLVLLCKPHHDYVDKRKPELFSIETLQAWKKEREADAVTQLRGLDGLTEDRLAEMIREAVARDPAASPVELDWQVGAQEFEDNLAVIFSSSDDIPLHRFLQHVEPEWHSQIETEGSVDQTITLLDRLTCLAACAIRWNRHEWASTVVDTLEKMYSAVLSAHGGIRPNLVAPGHQLLMAIVNRILGLGTVAVDEGAWQLITDLALRRPDHIPEMYTNWIRHTTTCASRERALNYADAQGRTVKTSYLEMTLRDIGDLRCLNPDAPATERFRTRLAGFDALATLAVYHYAPGDLDHPYYPWYLAYEPNRYEHAIALVLTNQEVRNIVFAGDDSSLARHLLKLEEFGRQEMAKFEGGWPYVDPTIRAFVADERKRQERQRLIASVQEQAKAMGLRFALSKRGRDPTIVTYTNGDTQGFVSDLETYKRLIERHKADRRTVTLGTPPNTIAEWSTEDLKRWLDDH